jgi:hypothetical protein
MRDVNGAYGLGANSFLVKPNDFEDLENLSRLIREFWLDASKRSSLTNLDDIIARYRSGVDLEEVRAEYFQD